MLVCKPCVVLMWVLKFEKAVTIFSNFTNKKKHVVYKLGHDSFWLRPKVQTILNCSKWNEATEIKINENRDQNIEIMLFLFIHSGIKYSTKVDLK